MQQPPLLKLKWQLIPAFKLHGPFWALASEGTARKGRARKAARKIAFMSMILRELSG
jgi:hypothetical protein